MVFGGGATYKKHAVFLHKYLLTTKVNMILKEGKIDAIYLQFI
jgi:hypothetical protein